MIARAGWTGLGRTGFLVVFLFGCPKEKVCSPDSVACTNDTVIAPLPEETTPEAQSSTGGKVCVHLRAIGCSDGYTPQATTQDGQKTMVGRSCTATVNKAIDQQITLVPVDCLLAAKDVGDAKHCGFVTCK